MDNEWQMGMVMEGLDPGAWTRPAADKTIGDKLHAINPHSGSLVRDRSHTYTSGWDDCDAVEQREVTITVEDRKRS